MLRARAYDAESGRFLQSDPLWFKSGDMNTYRYAMSKPTINTDPTGLSLASEFALQSDVALKKTPSIQAVGEGIACQFGTIASILDGIEVGKPVESIEIGVVSKCSAQVIQAQKKIVIKQFNALDPLFKGFNLGNDLINADPDERGDIWVAFLLSEVRTQLTEFFVNQPPGAPLKTTITKEVQILGKPIFSDSLIGLNASLSQATNFTY